MVLDFTGFSSLEPMTTPSNDLWEQPRPLGLMLRTTPSFLNLIDQIKLSHQGSAFERPQNLNTELPYPVMKMMQGSSSDRVNASYYSLNNQLMSEKLKASNFPADMIQIGSWKRVSNYEGDIVAKCYYAKRKLVWEVLDSGLKSKIEIQWSDISAIRANYHKNGPDTLEVELSQPPSFFRETDPQPRKHTAWQTTTDFTGGQAPVWRRHCIQFPEGTLEKHYIKLMHCDQRLYSLSQRPFPSRSSPYFSSDGEYEGYNMHDLSSYRLGDLSGYDGTFQESLPLQFPQFPHYDTMESTADTSWHVPRFRSSMTSSNGSTSPWSDFCHANGAMQQLEQQQSLVWESALRNQPEIAIGNDSRIERPPMSDFVNQITPSLAYRVDDEGMCTSDHNWELQNISKDLLNQEIDQQNVLAGGNPMPTLLDAPMPLYSTVENTDNRFDEHYYDSTVQLPVQDSIEHIPWHLPPLASYDPYFLNQAQEQFSCSDQTSHDVISSVQ